MKRYRETTKKYGTTYVHRQIMIEHLGRLLTVDEVVHHKNGDIHDNRIENLEVLFRPKHSKGHRIGARHSEQTKKRIQSSNIGAHDTVLTSEVLLEIDNLRSQNLSIRGVDKIVGISRASVHRAIKNRKHGAVVQGRDSRTTDVMR